MKELAIRKELTGLEPSMATQIENTFAPMVATFKAMESEIAEVVDLEQSPEKSAKANRLRLDIAKVRIAAEKAKTDQKAVYLRAGNAIQGAFNILKLAVNSYEDTLKAIEEHYERIEAARVQALYDSRVAELAEYNADGSALNLGTMNADAYRILLTGYKAAHEAAKAAEIQADKERLEAEKARLKAEKIRHAEIVKEVAARKAIEEKAAKERAEAEKAILAERRERESLERKMAAEKADADRKAREAAAAEATRLKKEAAAPDKQKLITCASEVLKVADGLTSAPAKEAIQKAYTILTTAAGLL